MTRAITISLGVAYRLEGISTAIRGIMLTRSADDEFGVTVWFHRSDAGCYTYWLDDEFEVLQFLNASSLGAWLSNRFKAAKKGPGRSSGDPTPFPQNATVLTLSQWKGADKTFVATTADAIERARKVDAFLAALPSAY